MSSTKKTYWLINQYSSTPETGIGGRHYYLAKELASQGHTVYLIAASDTHLLRKKPLVRDLFSIEKHEGFSFVWVKVPSYKNAHDNLRVRNWFLFAWRLLSLGKVIHDFPDVIIYSSPSLIGYLAAERLSKKYGSKLAFEVRDIWPLTFVDVGGKSPYHPFIWFLQWIEDRAYKKVDVVLSNLPNLFKHMESRGCGSSKFYWIPNGYDFKNIASLDPDESMKSRLDGKFVVGYAGTIGQANALEYLIEAAQILDNKDSDILIVLVGDGKNKTHLKEMGVNNENIVFFDAVDKSAVQGVISLFDVCFIGLTNDPLFKYGVSPNKIFDYFYAKKPVIYAIDSGNYKPVLAADAGLTIDPEDSGSIADAILALKSIPKEEREKIGQNGYDYAHRNHDYSKLAAKLSGIFN